MKGTDFILFWHGLMLLIIGAALFLRSGDAGRNYGRLCLILFCLLLGTAEWAAVFTMAFYSVPGIHTLRTVIFISAFIFLFEYIRYSRTGTARWLAVYPLVALSAGAAYYIGKDPLLAAQYLFALPGLIYLALLFFRGNQDDSEIHPGKKVAVPAVFAVYALTWTVPVPGCALPGFLYVTYVQEYLVSGALIARALCVTLIIALIFIRRYDYFFSTARKAGRYWLPAVFSMILCGAFILSTLSMFISENDMRNNITAIARGIAMGVNPDRVKELSFTIDDKDKPAFTRIRKQMRAWGRYMGIRSIHSMMMKQGRLIFGPENIDESDPLASRPGTEYIKPPVEFADAWIRGESGVTKPYIDEYGSFISGYAPVFDRSSGRVLMVVAVDYDASFWYSGIMKGRATGFVPFMIIALCIIFWLVIFDRRRASGNRRAVFFFRHLESLCCLISGIIITCIVSYYMNFFENRINAREFYNLADSWSNIIRSIILESRYYTEELSLYIENSEEVTWEEFRGFYSGKNNLPYVSIAWYPAVRASGKSAFESYMRRQNFRDYTIKRPAGGTIPAGSVYYPLAYIVPLEYGMTKLGHDISGVPELKDVLYSGQMTLIEQGSDEQMSPGGDMILLNPVFKKKRILGFVLSVVDLELLLKRVTSSRNSINLGIMVDISDINDDGSARTILSYPPSDSMDPDRRDEPALFQVYPVFYSGHTFGMKLYRSGSFTDAQLSIAGPLSFVIGLFLSFAVSALAGYLVFRRNTLEAEIEARTRESVENEERYRIVAEVTGQMVYGRDVDSGEMNWSGRIEEITGFMSVTFNTMGFEGWKNLVHPDDRERVLALLEESRKERKIFRCEYRMKRADGTYIIVEDEGAFLHYGMDKPVSILGVVKDITTRRRIEDALRESEERFRALHNASFGGIAIHDRGIIKVCNMGLAEMTGYTVDELTGMNGLLLIAPEWRDYVMENIRDGYVKSYDVAGIRKDGTIYAMEVNGRNIPYQGRIMRVTEFRDITERKSILEQLENNKKQLESSLEAQQAQMEEVEAINDELVEVNKRLAETEEKFSRAFRINPAIMVISRIKDGVLVDVNDMFLSATGYSRDAVIGSTIKDLNLFHDYSQRDMLIDLARKRGGVKNYEIMIRTSSGETRFGLLSADIIALKDGDYLLSVINDITDRKRFESAMVENEKKYRMLFDYSLDSIFIVEKNYFIDCNATALRMFRCSRDDLMGATPWEFSPAIQPGGENSEVLAAEKLEDVYSGKPCIFNWIHRAKDGTDFETEVYMVRLEIENKNFIMAIVRDISERKSYEARLSHMQKMDAIGQLAGGIAHDFNNQLGGIMGYAELLSIKLQDEGLKKYSDGIMAVASRASELAKRLLTFSRKSGLQMLQCDLHKIINDTIDILQHSIDKRITLTFSPNASDFIVRGDGADLQNSLLNLGLNARDAMENGGVLSFSTFNKTLTATEAASHLLIVPAGEYVAVSISDTGSGMSEEVKSHLFEPFFTTKSEGKGTGMGLASVYASVKNHHGTISVKSEDCKGTRFTIFLPLDKRSDDWQAIPEAEVYHVTGQRILIVDDERVIREILSELLQQEGHSVIEATDGNNALEIYSQSWNEIDLVILDMVMPGMNGRDTYSGMKKINSDVKVIIASGFSFSDDVRAEFINNVGAYVHKPFQKKELMKMIAEVVNR